MQHKMLSSRAVVIGCLVCWSATPADGGTWVIDLGETLLSLDPRVFENHGVWATPTGEAGAMEVDGAGRERLAFLIDPGSDFVVHIDENGVAFFEGSIRHVGGLTFGGPAGRRSLDTFVLDSDTYTTPYGFVTFGEAREGGRPGGLILRATHVEIDPAAEILLITGDDVRLSLGWASALGRPKLAQETIGTFALRARLVSLDGKEPVGFTPSSPSSARSAGEARASGPDVIVGILHAALASYGSEDGISAFAVGTTSCNKGDEELLWISSTNQHPVIGQNMFRLKDDRFEQIGMSWLKHGFTALQMDECNIGCHSSGTGTRLGVGCSDPYTAGLNGQQSYLGPRWQVNAHTGYFPYPPTRPPLTGSVIERRLQVHNVDLDPDLNDGAAYFVSSQYVAADDAQGGNGNNNESYARISVWWDSSDSRYRASVNGETQREQPGIRAWKDQDSDPSSILEVDVQIPGEGLLILAAKAIDVGGGIWRYEYALQNVNSHRSGGSFSVPLPPEVVAGAPGFHDVDYHSGGPYDNTDWTISITPMAVEWSSPQTYAQNPNSNALRWGTIYNFWFEANTPPRNVDATIGLFRPGVPDSVMVEALGPSAVPGTCTPTSDRLACQQDACVDAGEVCTSTVGMIDPSTGADVVLECDCLGQDECHLVFGDASVSCAGTCANPGNGCNLVHTDPLGDAFTCVCGPPTGVCCLDSSGGPVAFESCRELDEISCGDAGGVFKGLGALCTGIGACCLPSGSCGDAQSRECCEASGGVYGGPGSICEQSGACCFDADSDGINESCELMSEACCTAVAGLFHGPGIACGDFGACCFDITGLECVVMGAACCGDVVGDFHGAGSTCDDADEDGTPDVCLLPVELCPLLEPAPDPCADRQNIDCVNTDPSGEACLPRVVRIAFEPPDPELFAVPECDCLMSGDYCGPVQINPADGDSGATLSCGFVCPDEDDSCQIFINGVPTGEIIAEVSTFTPGDVVTCQCGCTNSPSPEPELGEDRNSRPAENSKNRYLSLSAGEPGRTQAIRVTFVDLPSPFHIWNDMIFFVGTPREACENSGKGLDTDPADCPAALPTDTFWTAPLVCEEQHAEYRDWHGWCDGGTCVGGLKPGASCGIDDDCVESLHLYNEGIVPSGVYAIQVLNSNCSPNKEGGFSAPLRMTQSAWGDVCGPSLTAGACMAVADGIVDVTNDVLGVLDKFANVSALQKARADIEPGDDGPNNGPDFKVNVANDVLFALDAFTGGSYPFAPVDPCPPG